MTQLSPHFTLEEFIANNHGIANIPDPEVIETLRWLCTNFLEFIRAHFDKPIKITSGYRGAVLNHIVGGVPTSEHQATEDYCAVDFQITGVLLQDAFDWIRLESKLPLDQVILEHGKLPRHDYDDCIHLGVRRTNPRMMALEGSTHGQSGYEPREFCV